MMGIDSLIYLQTNVEILASEEISLIRGQNAAQSYGGVNDCGVRGADSFLLGHAPSLWKVCAAVKATIDDAVRRRETETMVAVFNWKIGRP